MENIHDDNHPSFPQYPWLNYNEACDVLIIGGGLTGSFCLHNLASHGFNAVMLSQKPIGFSSSCAYSISQFENELLLCDIIKKHPKNVAIDYFKQCLSALDSIEKLSRKFGSHFARRDSIIFANSPQNVDLLHSEYLLRRHNGFEVQFLDQASARDDFSFQLSGGILAPNQAAELDDYALCHGLIKDSEDLGARIFENTTAVEIKVDNDQYKVVTAFGRHVTAKKIILCLGKSVCDYIDNDADVKTAFTAVTAPMESFDGYASRAIVRDLDRNITLHTTRDNSVVITGLDCSLLSTQSRLGKLIGIHKLADRKYQELELILHNMLTGLPTIDILHNYSADYLKTNDFFPVSSGLASFNDIFLSTPSSLNGVIHSYIAATSIAEKLLV